MRTSPSGARFLAWAALAVACDSGADKPAKSRVQAVLAPAGSAASSGTAAKVEVSPEPTAPATPRAVLCEGQLERKPQSFEPKRAPTQLSVDADVKLAPDPLRRVGDRWTWVNFWAAWCVPCKQELPLLLRWQATLGERLEFRFVSLDDDERQLRDFLMQQPAAGLRSSYWLPDGATRQAWLDALGMTTEPELPLQLLIDSSGRVRCRVQGAVEPQDLAALERIVRG